MVSVFRSINKLQDGKPFYIVYIFIFLLYFVIFIDDIFLRVDGLVIKALAMHIRGHELGSSASMLKARRRECVRPELETETCGSLEPTGISEEDVRC